MDPEKVSMMIMRTAAVLWVAAVSIAAGANMADRQYQKAETRKTLYNTMRAGVTQAEEAHDA